MIPQPSSSFLPTLKGTLIAILLSKAGQATKFEDGSFWPNAITFNVKFLFKYFLKANKMISHKSLYSNALRP